MMYLTNCNWMNKPYLDSKENHHPTTPSLFKQTAINILKIRNSILFTILFVAFAQVCWGLTTGDFQSRAVNGNWVDFNAWSIYNTNGAGWKDAIVGQIPTTTSGVTILSGNTITSDIAGCLAGNLTINIGGTLICSGTSNLTVYGSFANNGVFTASSGIFTMSGSTITSISVGSGSSIIFNELVIDNKNTTSGVRAQTGFTVSENMTINPKSYFSASNNEIFTINGNFTNNGTFKYNKSTVIMGGTSTKNISGTASEIIFNNLSIANTGGITTDKDFTVIGNMTIDALCSFIPGSLNVISGISSESLLLGSGSVYVTRAKGSISGDYTKQYASFSKFVENVEYVGNIADQVVSPLLTYKTLRINNNNGYGSSLSGDVKCETLIITSGILTVASAGRLEVTGITNLDYIAPDPPSPPLQKRFESCLVLQSDAGSTGSFKFSYKADNTPNIAGNGNMRVERYMSNDDHWHLYCSPMKNQSIRDFLKYNPEIPDLVDGSGKVIGVGMRQYLTSFDNWDNYYIYKSTDSGEMANAKGFLISTIPDRPLDAGAGTIEATGIPNDKIVNLAIDGSNNGWNCIGNPYTSAIANASFLAGNTDLTTEVPFQNLYLWDETKSGYFPANGYVQAGQGFFVKSKLAGGLVHFTSDMQSFANTVAFKSATLDLPSISLIAQFQTLRSTTQIGFVTNTTKGLDLGYDAGMLKANKDFALYSRLIEDIGVDFCLQSLPDQNYDQYVIPIGIDFKVGGVLTFSAETVNLPVGCLAVLEDRLTKQFTRLDLKDAKYTATVSANTKGTGRFFLHTSDVISSVHAIENEPFKISKIGKTLYINGDVSDKANFFVYSVNGKQLANFKAESQIQNQFDASGFPAGVYILTCDDQNQKKSTKFVLEN